MKVEPHYAQLLTVSGFIQRYFEFCCTYPSLIEAYEATERQYELVFSRRKYSDYDTFRVVLSRWNKDRKKTTP